MAVLLGVENLRIRYGAVEALTGVSLTVGDGEIVTVLGANGAGKSTLLAAISGLVPAVEGSIAFGGEPLLRTQAWQIVEKGISHAPEGRKVFATLSVEENLNLGAFIRRRERQDVAAARNRVFELFPVLKERRRQLAGTLSGGEQQMLAIGRALMSTPRMLLLDEPSLGLAPIYVRLIFDIIREINRRGVAILLVEQNAHQALDIASRGYVLENGHIVLEGPSAELKENPSVRAAYLGGRALKTS